MANQPDPGDDNVPDAEELPDELGLDPDEMKNPDRSDEGRRRRETGSDPDEGLGGMEAAKRLYGGEREREAQTFEVGDRVAYLADHQEEYEDASATGTVSGVRDNGILVDYNDGSPNAKLTPRHNLQNIDSDE